MSVWTFREKLGRTLWGLARATLFRFSWHGWYGWRAWLLRRFGARIGRRVRIRPSAWIEIPWLLSVDDLTSLGDHCIIYNLGPVSIGRRSTISHRAQLCAGTHDYTDPTFPLLRPGITLGDDVWIAASAFVGPGVKAGNGAVLGACAAAFKDLEPWTVYTGNPAKPAKPRPRLVPEAG